MIDFSVAIPHAAFDPTRVRSLGRLLECVAPVTTGRPSRVEPSHAPTERHVWSERIWKWGAAQSTSHFLQLQDDVIVAPDFWRHLEAMVRAVPSAPICLFTVHEAARAIAERGGPWLTTTDWMVGPAYVLPTPLLEEFVEWRASLLRPGAVKAITEDTLLGLWCAWTGRKIWHPTVSIVEHDTSVASLYGNGDAAHNRASCSWQDTPVPTDWTPRNPLPLPNGPVPHFGRRYPFTPYHAAKWIEPCDSAVWIERLDRLERDVVVVRAVPEETAPCSKD